MQMSVDECKAVRDYWEKPDTISLRDDNLRQLETEAVALWLDPECVVLDVGCGDGVNTITYARRVRRIIGIDYSEQMIRRATRRLVDSRLDNVEFQNLLIQDLNKFSEQFDRVISQRCLINLPTFQAQTDAVCAIHDALKPGGIYLLLECFEEGRRWLNEYRKKVGLSPLPVPWHNLFFNEDQLYPVLDVFFDLLEVVDFSLYYLVTRILNPMMGLNLEDQLSRLIDQSARDLQARIGFDSLSWGIGPQKLIVLRKRK